jgi:hypothetical protein
MKAAPSAPSRAAELLGLLALAAGPGCGTSAQAEPPLLRVRALAGTSAPGERAPRPNFHDFGAVRKGRAVEHTFVLENQGRSPVTITRIDPSCGCAVGAVRARGPAGEVVPGKPARPGARDLLNVPAGWEADLVLRVDTGGSIARNVDRTLVTRLTARVGAEREQYLTFDTHIRVEEPLLVVPAEIRLGAVPRAGGRPSAVDIVPFPGFDLRPSAVRAHPPEVEVELRQEERSGVGVWVLSVGFAPGTELGQVRGTITLDVAHADGTSDEPLLVPFSGEVVENVHAEPTRLVLRAERGSSTPAVGSVLVESLLEGARLRILRATVDEAQRAFFEPRFEALEPDAEGRSARWRVELVARALPESQVTVGTLALELDDPQTPQLAVPYVVHVR